MSRHEHPHKEIDAVIEMAIRLGWRLEKARGHAWGRLYCPLSDRAGCIISVWCTPKNPENHAKSLKRDVTKCGHELIFGKEMA